MRPEQLPIAEPCNADWNAMEPRERARFCGQCGIEVIDVSAFTEAEACELARRPRNGRVCVSYVVRADGTLRLADTPDVPVRSLVRRGRTLMVAASLALAACGTVSEPPRTAGTMPITHSQKPGPIAEPDRRVAGGLRPIEPPPPPVDAGVPEPRTPDGPTEHRLRGRMPSTPGPDRPNQP